MTNTIENAAAESLPRVYRIPSYRMPEVEVAIAKLQRRAAKLGLDAGAIGFTVVDTQEEIDEVTGAVERFTLVTVRGEAPRLAGWTFVAKLEHLGTVDGVALGNLVKASPNVVVGADELARYRMVESGCDHCAVMRRRNDTYIVRHESGETRQVGSTCLAAFLGGLSPAAAVGALELFADIESLLLGEECGGGGRGRREVVLLSFLSVAVMVAKRDGWVSRGMARERVGVQATADTAWGLIFPPPMHEREAAKERSKVTDDDRAFAAAAVEAALALGSGEAALGDYEHNLSVIARVPVIDSRMAGLAASLYVWHARRIEQEIARRHAAATSNHVGTVKGKLEDVPVTLARVSSFDSPQYGTTHIHRFVDALGNVLVWKTGSVCLEPGKAYHLSATIKAHTEYKGVKQTEVTRAVCNTDAEQAAKLATLAAAKAEKAARRRAPRKAKAAECPGHESTEGPAGVSVYCDGTCR